MTYELMKTEHLPAVEKLQQDWFAENITYGFVAGTARQIADAMTPYCLVAKDGGRVVGFIMAEVKHGNEFCIFPNGADFLEIFDLYVAKEYRSKGVGKELLLRCENIARESGINYVHLSSATKDGEAVRKFYTGNDYTVWTTSFFKAL